VGPVVYDNNTRIVGAERRRLGKEFVERYNAGESTQSLADSINRSHTFAYGLLKESGVTFRGKVVSLSIAEQRALGKSLARRYEAGESVRGLAASIGRSPGFTRMLLIEAGVTFRATGWESARIAKW
jgi:hypothetical protein